MTIAFSSAPISGRSAIGGFGASVMCAVSTPVSDEAGVLTTVVELDRRPGYFEIPRPAIEASEAGVLPILPREPDGRVDLLCLRSDGKDPTDAEFRAGAKSDTAVFLRAADFDAKASVPAPERGGRWETHPDPQALAGRYVLSTGHAPRDTPQAHLDYRLPPLKPGGEWVLWARVIFPDVDKDSFFWQHSPDGGKTWNPTQPLDTHAVGWEQPATYRWVRARPSPEERTRPVCAGDLREVTRTQRRPELYGAAW